MPVLNTFCTDERIGRLAHILGFSPQNDHFQAMMVIQVNMQCRNDALVVLMLEFGQFFAQHAHVVVVDDRNCSNYAGISVFRLLLLTVRLEPDLGKLLIGSHTRVGLSACRIDPIGLIQSLAQHVVRQT